MLLRYFYGFSFPQTLAKRLVKNLAKTKSLVTSLGLGLETAMSMTD